MPRLCRARASQTEVTTNQTQHRLEAVHKAIRTTEEALENDRWNLNSTRSAIIAVYALVLTTHILSHGVTVSKRLYYILCTNKQEKSNSEPSPTMFFLLFPSYYFVSLLLPPTHLLFSPSFFPFLFLPLSPQFLSFSFPLSCLSPLSLFSPFCLSLPCCLLFYSHVSTFLP